MCYSAQVWPDYRRYRQWWRAEVDVAEFNRLYTLKRDRGGIKTLRAMDDALLNGDIPQLRKVVAASLEAEHTRCQAELARAHRRLDDPAYLHRHGSSRSADSLRQQTRARIAQLEAELQDLARQTPSPMDACVVPGIYAPVLLMEDGRKVIKPMRYRCRPPGKQPFFDIRYADAYNAKLDALDGFWSGQFGYSHGLIVADALLDQVVGTDGMLRPLRALAPDTHPMLLACVWARWSDPKGSAPDLLSFATITDFNSTAGTQGFPQRTAIDINPANLDSWLQPDPSWRELLYAVLADRKPIRLEAMGPEALQTAG